MLKIKINERQAIIQSLRSGQTPRSGLAHIQVGRVRELEQLMGDLQTAQQGGAALRFVIGDYGAGKTFFLNLVKLQALQKGFVVVSADVTNDRRLQGSGGQVVSLFNELMRNLATRTRPDGSALKSVIEKFIAEAVDKSEKTERPVRSVIRDRLGELQDLVAGFDFADVLNTYFEGYEAQDENRQQSALKWLRGEFASKVDARKALGVRSMVDDDTVYDYIKLLAKFSVLAGYKGLLVQLDELASIHQLSSSQARQQNYEQILRIFNDVNQGSAEHLVIMMGGTPDFLEDPRRGLYGHEALRTRLAPNSFAKGGLVDYAHPVMRLPQLTRDDLVELLVKVRAVFNTGETPRIDDVGLAEFVNHCFSKVGDAAFRTPRETVKEFTGLLSMLEQYPGSSWQQHLGGGEASKAASSVSNASKSASSNSSSKETTLAGLESFRL